MIKYIILVFCLFFLPKMSFVNLFGHIFNTYSVFNYDLLIFFKHESSSHVMKEIKKE